MGVRLLSLVLPSFLFKAATQHPWSSPPVSLFRCSSAVYAIVVGFLGQQLTGVSGHVCYCGFLPFVPMPLLLNMLHSCRLLQYSFLASLLVLSEHHSWSHLCSSCQSCKGFSAQLMSISTSRWSEIEDGTLTLFSAYQPDVLTEACCVWQHHQIWTAPLLQW